MKVIDVIDTTSGYTLDVVSCYERCIANVIGYYSHANGDIYLAQKNIFRVYDFPKEEIVNLCDESRLCADSYTSISYKKICAAIKEDKLTVVGLDLYDVVESRYYKNTHWPHWAVVKGYDAMSDAVFILDNEPYDVFEEKYYTRKIRYCDLDKANKSFRKRYGTERSVAVFDREKIEGFNFSWSVVLDSYIKAIEHSYGLKWQILLNEYINVFNMENLGKNMILPEMKKKIVNISKVYSSVWREFADILPSGNDGLKNRCMKMADELQACFGAHTIRQFIDIHNRTIGEIVVPDNVKALEKESLTCLKEVLVAKASKDIGNRELNVFIEKAEKDSELISGDPKQGAIIRRKYMDNYIMILKGSNDYNWWENDNAPKAVIKSFNIKPKGSSLHMTFNVTCVKERDEDVNYQAGIFLSGDDGGSMHGNDYMCAINNHNEIVVSRIKDREIKSNISLGEGEKLSVLVDGKNIYMGKRSEGVDMYMVKMRHELMGNVNVGVVCKRWESICGLGIEVKEIDLEE